MKSHGEFRGPFTERIERQPGRVFKRQKPGFEKKNRQDFSGMIGQLPLKSIKS